MNLLQCSRATAVGLLLVTLTGCASIVGAVDKNSRRVIVKTDPPGATITVTRRNSTSRMRVARSPAELYLPRAYSWFRGEEYTLHIAREGYETIQRDVHTVLNPWYFGNIFVGGIPGMVFFDPIIGGIWHFSPYQINETLTASTPTVTGTSPPTTPATASEPTPDQPPP